MPPRPLALLAALLPALALAGAQAEAPPRAADAGEVRTLEARVSALREKIYRPRNRLQDLRTKVSGAEASATRAVLVHRNEMGGAYRLESVNYQLDGAPLYARVDLDGDLARASELEVFQGELPPGEHRLAVELVYRGHGGPARRYVDGHRFTVRGVHVFAAEPGSVSMLRIVGFERGGVATELKDRPSVRFEGSVRREPPAAGAKQTPAAAGSVQGGPGR